MMRVTEHGAKGDGVANDTAAIQRALDACGNSGGGTVVFPAGHTFLCGSILIRPRTEFRVEAGARLIGASQESDYPLFAFTTGAESGKRAWIAAQRADDISITGGGIIDGRCRLFSLEEGPYIHTRTLRWRPAMTCFEACNRMRIHDITFENAANWALHFTGCEDVEVTRVRILNDLKFPNCDGIDPDHCRNVRISDCHVEAGDDCVVLKNTAAFAQYGPCENVTVSNCTLVSTSSAIKIGTESHGDFRNIVFRNCTIRGTNRGLSIQLRDGGNVENVAFSDMTVETRLFEGGWWGCAEPIYVTALPRTPETRVGRISDVTFRNISCRSQNGVFIMGSRPDRIDRLLLENVSLEIGRTSRWQGGRYDTRPCPPEVRPRDSVPLGELTPWGQMVSRRNAGIYMENAAGVTLRKCAVRWMPDPPDYYGEALETHNVTGLEVAGFSGQPAHV